MLLQGRRPPFTHPRVLGGPHSSQCRLPPCTPASPQRVSLNLSNPTRKEDSLQAENLAHTQLLPSPGWGSSKATGWSHLPRRGGGARLLPDPNTQLTARWGSSGAAEVSVLLMWQSSPLSLPPPGASMGEMSKLPVGPSAKSGVRPQRVTARLEDKHRLGEGVSHSPGWSWGGGVPLPVPPLGRGLCPRGTWLGPQVWWLWRGLWTLDSGSEQLVTGTEKGTP